MQPTNTLEINLVAGCQVRCSYCPYSKLIKSYQRDYPSLHFSLRNNQVPLMSFDIFKIILSKLPKHEMWIDWSGFVENFLHPETERFMCYAHDLGFQQRLYTTLANCTVERLQKIQHINFLCISLHLVDSLEMLKIVVNEEYLNALEYASHLRSVSAHTFGYMHPKIKEAQKTRFKTLHIDEKINNRDIISRASNVECNNDVIQLKLPPKKSGPIICRAIQAKGSTKYSHNVCDIFGNIYLCCCDFSREVKLGNLLEQSYDSLFESDNYIAIIEGSKAQDSDIICRGCELSKHHDWN